MPPPPWFGVGDHLCPYVRKLIGFLVPVHSRSVWSNTYAFLDPSLKLVAFLLNYFTCFPIHNMIVLTDVVCYGWFMVLIGRSSAGGSCEIFVRDLFCFLSVFCDPSVIICIIGDKGPSLPCRDLSIHLLLVYRWSHFFCDWQFSCLRKTLIPSRTSQPIGIFPTLRNQIEMIFMGLSGSHSLSPCLSPSHTRSFLCPLLPSTCYTGYIT